MAGVLGDDVDEPLGGRVVGQPAGVVEQLTQGHPVPRGRLIGQHLADRGVQVQSAAVDEPQGHRSAEGLGDTGDPHVVGGPRWPPALQVGHARPVDLRTVAVAQDGDDAGGPVGALHQLPQLLLEGGPRRRVAVRSGLRGLHGGA